MGNETGVGKVRLQSLPCPNCGGVKEYIVNEVDYRLYRRNYHIQEAFPSLPAEDRERFISGYCGSCWDLLFGDDEGEGE